MQNEEIFELCLNILIEYYKISGHVTLMWNIVLCLNKYLFTNLCEFALKIFLISRLFIILFFFSLIMNVLETVPSQNSVMPHNAFLQSQNRDSSSFMLENIFFCFFGHSCWNSLPKLCFL